MYIDNILIINILKINFEYYTINLKLIIKEYSVKTPQDF